MPPLNLTEALIREHTSGETFQRGREYERRGAVISLWRRGNVFQAEVEGNAPAPYQVRVVFEEGGGIEASCSCPYDWGDWCKHIVAALLASLHRPDAVEERPDLRGLLSDLSREQLQTLLLNLAERDPSLASLVEQQTGLPRATSAPTPSAQASQPRSRRTPVDASALRRQVRAILHSLDHLRRSEAYWHVGGVVGQVLKVLDQARAFIEAGDGRSGLAILEVITEEYVDGWTLLDDSDGEASGFLRELGFAWTEALLSADLTRAERKSWTRKLAAWSGEVEDYVEAAFAAALEAAQHGWDHPLLAGAIRGDTPREAQERHPFEWSGALAAAGLNVLDHQGRSEEYLRLAEAAGQAERYATMLVRLGRAADAVCYGLMHLPTTDEALALARALSERGHLEGALRIAEYGLTLEGWKASLATWLRDLASALGQTERALHAAVVVFQEAPDLAAYLRVQELAAGRWLELRVQLLEHLRRAQAPSPDGQVEILLHEGLVDDAIAAVEGSMAYALIERVVSAAIASHPDWVIDTCRRHAETIMDRGEAQHYYHAARWLAHARAAYRSASREAEWRAYLAALLARHARKYKLRPMLEPLKD